MEVAAAQCLSSSFPSFLHGRSSIASTVSYPSHIGSCWAFKKSLCAQQQQQLRSSLRATQIQQKRRRAQILLVSASSSSSLEASASTDVWLLEPIGDGDWKHIGVKVPRPGSYEIYSNSVIVGRVPDKADLVIPVATVSGLHARFEKRQGNLYVTDLNSTNGTYVNERRLNPGEVFPVVPGNRVTFGDTHLAIFLVSKIENVPVKEEATAGGEENANQESSSDALQAETTS